jgi:hypothetical protein
VEDIESGCKIGVGVSPSKGGGVAVQGRLDKGRG